MRLFHIFLLEPDPAFEFNIGILSIINKIPRYCWTKGGSKRTYNKLFKSLPIHQSPIWTSLINLAWNFGIVLKPIFSNDPAIPNYVHIKRGQKWIILLFYQGPVYIVSYFWNLCQSTTLLNGPFLKVIRTIFISNVVRTSLSSSTLLHFICINIWVDFLHSYWFKSSLKYDR